MENVEFLKQGRSVLSLPLQRSWHAVLVALQVVSCTHVDSYNLELNVSPAEIERPYLGNPTSTVMEFTFDSPDRDEMGFSLSLEADPDGQSVTPCFVVAAKAKRVRILLVFSSEKVGAEVFDFVRCKAIDADTDLRNGNGFLLPAASELRVVVSNLTSFSDSKNWATLKFAPRRNVVENSPAAGAVP